jgi:PP-loop superfamily ATP-utilizing enzyme
LPAGLELSLSEKIKKLRYASAFLRDVPVSVIVDVLKSQNSVVVNVEAGEVKEILEATRKLGEAFQKFAGG